MVSASEMSALGHLSCGRTARCLPKLRGRRLPIKCMVARTMLLQILDATNSFLDAWPMTDRHPPQHHGWSVKMLKPIGTATIKVFMNCPPDKAFKCSHTFPNRKIDDDSRVGKRPRIRGAATVVDIAPDETGAAFGNTVHQCKIIREFRHARIVDVVANAADVQLGKMMVGWLLHIMLRRLAAWFGVRNGTVSLQRPHQKKLADV